MDALPPAAFAEIVATLAPFVRYLSTHYDVSCALQDPARTERGVVFTVATRFVDLASRTHPDALVRLREALDLFYRMLTLHLPLVLLFANEHGAGIRGCDRNAAVRRCLLRGAPFELVALVDIRQIRRVRTIHRTIVKTFLIQLTLHPSTDARYCDAKAILDRVLETVRPQWAVGGDHTPIRVRCSIETLSSVYVDSYEPEDHVTPLVAMAEALDAFEPPARAFSFGHVPVQVEIDRVVLRSTQITPSAILAVIKLARLRRVRLNCELVTIDPRLITCAYSDLAAFLEAIADDATSPSGVVVEVVPTNDDDNDETVAMETEVDVKRFVEMLFHALSVSDRITELRIGSLLNLFPRLQSRDRIYKALVTTVFARAKPLDVILLWADVDENDAYMLSTHVARWRVEHPGGKLRVGRLTLKLDDLDNVFLEALIAALDEVDALTVDNAGDLDAPPISSAQVTAILTTLPTLRTLSLTHVHVDTMRIFRDQAPPTLEVIELCGLCLNDRASFLAFVQDLADAELPLTQRLRQLAIRKHSILAWSEHFQLSPADVQQLANALQANHVLETVSVVLNDQEDLLTRLRQTRLLQATAGWTLPAALRVRRSSEEKARRVAFLSVLQKTLDDGLDTFLLRRIFAFSDPWVERRVHAWCY